MVFSAIHYICPLPTPNSTSNSTCCTSWHLSLTAWETLSRLQPHLFSTQTYQITAIRSPLPSLLWDLQLKFKAGRRTMYQALLSLQSFRAFLGGQVMVLPALYPKEPSGRCLSTIATVSQVSSAANLMGMQLWLKNMLRKKKIQCQAT